MSPGSEGDTVTYHCLSFIPHAKLCIKNSNFYIQRLRKIKDLFSHENRLTLVQGLVHSRLDCSNIFFLGLPLKWQKKLQAIQNQVARLVSGCARTDHISPVLEKLHWLPIAKRVLFKAMCYMYRAHRKLGPIYLSEWAPCTVKTTPIGQLTSHRTDNQQTKIYW